LHKAKKDDHKRRIKALIAPHSALSLSGATAAWAYQYVTPSDEYQRVFVLGPSHQKYFTGLALSVVDQLDTPIGSLSVDK
jgi:AmmeMemoRadiSam system protein B